LTFIDQIIVNHHVCSTHVITSNRIHTINDVFVYFKEKSAECQRTIHLRERSAAEFPSGASDCSVISIVNNRTHRSYFSCRIEKRNIS
jgi:hypothetical protein